MANRYPGFPKEGLQFLAELKQNNNREWFQARKQQYEDSVKAPSLNLVEALNAELVRFAPEHVTDPAKALFRIYRDTRFSKDKTPYKTHSAAQFPRTARKGQISAGFYFHLSPEEVGVGGGLYMPPPKELLTIRTWISENSAAFKKIIGTPTARKLFGEIEGDQLRRIPKGFPADHPAQSLLRRKSYFFWAQLPPEQAVSPKIVKEIASRFEAAAPLVDTLNRALGLL